jgi:hypothetical protein
MQTEPSVLAAAVVDASITFSCRGIHDSASLALLLGHCRQEASVYGFTAPQRRHWILSSRARVLAVASSLLAKTKRDETHFFLSTMILLCEKK